MFCQTLGCLQLDHMGLSTLRAAQAGAACLFGLCECLLDMQVQAALEVCGGDREGEFIVPHSRGRKVKSRGV